MSLFVINLIIALTKFMQTPTRAHRPDHQFVHVDLSTRCRLINGMDRLFGLGQLAGSL